MIQTSIEKLLTQAITLQQTMETEERANEYLPQALFVGRRLVKKMDNGSVTRAEIADDVTQFFYFLELGGFFAEQ